MDRLPAAVAAAVSSHMNSVATISDLMEHYTDTRNLILELGNEHQVHLGSLRNELASAMVSSVETLIEKL